MSLSIGDLADKYSILLIKEEKGLDVQEELDVFEPKYRSKALLKINREMWNIENEITKELGLVPPEHQLSDKTFIALGLSCYHLRKLNRLRVAAKNKINEENGGYIERKNY